MYLREINKGTTGCSGRDGVTYKVQRGTVWSLSLSWEGGQESRFRGSVTELNSSIKIHLLKRYVIEKNWWHIIYVLTILFIRNSKD